MSAFLVCIEGVSKVGKSVMDKISKATNHLRLLWFALELCFSVLILGLFG